MRFKFRGVREACSSVAVGVSVMIAPGVWGDYCPFPSKSGECPPGCETVPHCCTGQPVCVLKGTSPCEPCIGGGCVVCVRAGTSCGLTAPCGWYESVPAEVGEEIEFTAHVIEWVAGLEYYWSIDEGAGLVLPLDPMSPGDDTLRVLALGEGTVTVSVAITGHPCQLPTGCDCGYIDATVEIHQDLPGSCQSVDCNGNGVPDDQDIIEGTSSDCNYNGRPDECDILDGTSLDDDGNGIPDECECGCMDLVFVVDTTASMAGAVQNIKIDLPRLVNVARSRAADDLRLGLVTFKDEVEVVHALTDDLAAVEASIATLELAGGGGPPEASDEALREVITMDSKCLAPESPAFDVPFRPECYKFAVLVTDALPAGCDDLYEQGVDDLNALQRALDAASAGIQIGAVLVPPPFPQPDLEPIMQQYADETGGVMEVVEPNGEGTADAAESMLNVCLDCNGNGVLDLVDIGEGTSTDTNENGIPDECERCPGDISGDGNVGSDDLIAVLAAWGPCPGCPADIDGSGTVGTTDLLIVLSNWGPCPDICDPGYIPLPGDPDPQRFCDPEYRDALVVINDMIGMNDPPGSPFNIFCVALEALDQGSRCAALDGATTYWQIEKDLVSTIKVFLDDGGPPLLMRFEPVYDAADPWGDLVDWPGHQEKLELVAWLGDGGGGGGLAPPGGVADFDPCYDETTLYEDPDDPIPGWAVDRAKAVLTTASSALEWIDFANNVRRGVCNVTDPCFVYKMFDAYLVINDGLDACPMGIDCIATIGSSGFVFTNVTGLIRVFFYYMALDTCFELYPSGEAVWNQDTLRSLLQTAQFQLHQYIQDEHGMSCQPGCP